MVPFLEKKIHSSHVKVQNDDFVEAWGFQKRSDTIAEGVIGWTGHSYAKVQCQWLFEIFPYVASVNRRTSCWMGDNSISYSLGLIFFFFLIFIMQKCSYNFKTPNKAVITWCNYKTDFYSTNLFYADETTLIIALWWN